MIDILRDPSRRTAGLIVVASSFLLACDPGGGRDATDPGDADIPGDPIGDACDVIASEDSPVPIAGVCFEESAPPAAAAQALDGWFNGSCNRPASDSQSWLECPALEGSFQCRSVLALGPTGDWLDGRPDALKCLSCQPEAQGLPCECADGLDRHGIGMGGVLCDYLLLIDEGHVNAIRNREDLVARFAPVEDAGEALAFVELLGTSVKHLFTRYDFLWAGSSTPNYPMTYESNCTSGTLQGTFVESSGADFIVHTYQVPDLDGCTFDSLTRVTYKVTRSGGISLLESHAVCHAGVPCID